MRKRIEKVVMVLVAVLVLAYDMNEKVKLHKTEIKTFYTSLKISLNRVK